MARTVGMHRGGEKGARRLQPLSPGGAGTPPGGGVAGQAQSFSDKASCGQRWKEGGEPLACPPLSTADLHGPPACLPSSLVNAGLWGTGTLEGPEGRQTAGIWPTASLRGWGSLRGCAALYDCRSCQGPQLSAGLPFLPGAGAWRWEWLPTLLGSECLRSRAG